MRAMKPIKVFGDHDPNTWQQMLACMEFADYGVLSADNHLGYNHPVGAGTASSEYVSVSGVGFDIGCGNKAVLTDLDYADVEPDLSRIMDQIAHDVSFGVGRTRIALIDHPVLHEIARSPVMFQRGLAQLAAAQLGTVGAGNHYVDLFHDEDFKVWVGVHFGSRGFGHKTASRYMRDTDMMGPPTVLEADSLKGQEYVEAVRVAGDYAYAGRDVVVDQVLGILGAQATYEVHNHHNYLWRENHFGRDLWIVRKGCTPAFPGQQGFVGGSMGDISVILEGVDTDANREGLYSTIHGAGRAMSRTMAAGKVRRRWTCNTRECGWVQPPETHKPDACPQCGNTRMQRVPVRITKGAIDWDSVLVDLQAKNIQLRGGAADEAPGAYKRIEDVLAAHGDAVMVKHTLTPIGVVMAGPETVDPYKD